MDEALRIREFWLGRLLGSSLQGPVEQTLALELTHRAALWFAADSPQRRQRDARMRAEFQDVLARAARGTFAAWADSPRRRLSLIILFDQFPRQIHRGTAEAFRHDEQALGLALSGMQSAADGALNVIERLFFYMPLQHAESPEVQEESVAAYRRLLAETSAALRRTFEAALQSALEHRQLIGRFGRFPHRNALLGRSNTPEEEVYLKGHPSSFGQ